MALPWNVLRTEPKLLSLLETVGRNQYEGEPIICRICDNVFFDNEVLLSHFHSHLNEDGTLKPGLSYMSSRDQINFMSNSPHVNRSLSVPVKAGDLGTSTRQSISPNRPNLSTAGNFVGPKLLENSVQLRGPALTHRPQSDQSPTNFNSPITQGESSSQPNQSLNFHSGSSSQPIGLPNFRSTVTPVPSGISISRSVQVSDFHLSMSSGASASPPKFQPPTSTGASASRFVPGTRNSVPGPNSSSFMRSARQTAVRGGYTKPYILQLEQPIKKMRMSRNDGGDSNNNRDEMDLTLKL